MTDSILTSTKKLLGITEDYEHFDTDIIIHINTVFSILNQIGIGPKDTFSITDKNDIWTDFLDDKENLEMIKTYMYMRVRMMFDPPSGAAKESMEKIIKETETRMYYLEEY